MLLPNRRTERPRRNPLARSLDGIRSEPRLPTLPYTTLGGGGRGQLQPEASVSHSAPPDIPEGSPPTAHGGQVSSPRQELGTTSQRSGAEGRRPICSPPHVVSTAAACTTTRTGCYTIVGPETPSWSLFGPENPRERRGLNVSTIPMTSRSGRCVRNRLYSNVHIHIHPRTKKKRSVTKPGGEKKKNYMYEHSNLVYSTLSSKKINKNIYVYVLYV